MAFHQDCDDDALIDAYRRSLCVVLPSVYKTMYGDETTVPELLGQTLLEGMACGSPVICTRVASLPEVVEDGVTGFIVPPNSPARLGGTNPLAERSSGGSWHDGASGTPSHAREVHMGWGRSPLSHDIRERCAPAVGRIPTTIIQKPCCAAG